ncbi:hypothetical protein EON82_18065, partial [bacterium]
MAGKRGAGSWNCSLCLLRSTYSLDGAGDASMKVSVSSFPYQSALPRAAVAFRSALVPTAIFVVCGLFSLWTMVGHETAASKKLISDIIAVLAATGGMVWGLWGARKALREGGDRRKALSANLLALGTG